MYKYITASLLLLASLSISAQDTTSTQWSEHYLMLGAGLQSQEEITNFGRVSPYFSLGVGSFDDQNRRGRFLQLGISASDQSFQRRFSIRDDNSTCIFCYRDTVGQVRSDILSVDVIAGRIWPLKTFGEQHRVSLVPSIGYTYQQATVTYLDEATNGGDYSKKRHGLLATVDVQYRYLIASGFYVGASATLARLVWAIEREERERSTGTFVSTLLSRDVYIGTGISLLAGIRF